MGEKTPEAPINASPNDQARVARWGGVQEGDPSDWAVPRECRVRVPDLGGVEPPKIGQQSKGSLIGSLHLTGQSSKNGLFISFFFLYISPHWLSDYTAVENKKSYNLL